MATLFVHIFIHGTILGGYFLLNPAAVWNNCLTEQDKAVQCLYNARKDHHLISHAELLLGTGLTDITPMVIANNPKDTYFLYHERAAITITRAFHALFKTQIGPQDTTYYYTFGWSGLLSEQHRKAHARELYNELYMTLQKLQQKHPKDTISCSLYGHSHGGQLIAHLAEIHNEKEITEKNRIAIRLDTAYLCATPLVATSMMQLLNSDLFYRIYNIYSSKDWIQTIDIISTPDHHCFQRIEQLPIALPSEKTTSVTFTDIEIAVHDTPHAANHSSFFSCSDYRIPGYLKSLRVVKKIIDLFRPLPLLIWYAPLDRLCRICTLPGYSKWKFNLFQGDTQDQIYAQLAHSCSPLRACTDVIQPIAGSRYTIQSKKTNGYTQYQQRAAKSGWQHLWTFLRYLS